jgi:radical SAM protein with 4Fe4S-binding SPASM domain
MTDPMLALGARAAALGVPLFVHLDVTYRCNERCVHCYLDHDDRGEMTFGEIASVLRQLAEAGALFLTLSGGEVFLRRDFLDIIRLARSLDFCVRVKTNGVLIRDRDADALRDLGVHEVQVSIYSHRAEVHDAITKLPGSFARSVAAIERLTARGLRVVIANVLMTQNFGDYGGVRALAGRLGVECTIDPMVTPHISGDRAPLALGISAAELREAFHDPALIGEAAGAGAGACAPPGGPDADTLDATPCSAGHTACYVSPYGDVFPCVQFPLPTGNVRTHSFGEIWRESPAFAAVRAIRVRDLTTCPSCAHVGSCSRCPGLAFMEGSMHGPSSLDCAKSFARTGVASAGMLAREPVVTRDAVIPDAVIPLDHLRASASHPRHALPPGA